MKQFSKNELERYSRQILLYGKEGQLRFFNTRILVVGTGGLGSSVLPLLAASGVGSITVIDDDLVERSNLGRQILFDERQLGQPKVQVTRTRLLQLNGDIEVFTEQARLTPENGQSLFEQADLVLEGSDSIETKFLASDLAIKTQTPLLIGGLGTVQGHIFPVWPGAACYRCVFEEPPPAGSLLSCATAGVLSSLPAVVGAMMANLCSLYIAEDARPEKLFLLEQGNWRTLALKRRNDCAGCSKSA